MKHIILAILLLQKTYYTETIDNIVQLKSNKPFVIITGIPAVLSMNDKKEIEFRLGDEHGHYINCILPAQSAQPRLGIKIKVWGAVSKYTALYHPIIEINPVDKIEPVE